MGNTHDTEIARLEADIQTKWKTSDDYRWGYGGDRGPDTWWIHYPSASGGKQSPIDIITEEATTESDYGTVPIKVNYHIPPPLHQSTDSLEESMETKILVNNGTTIRVNIVNSHSYITGGPCKGYTYVLEQFHMHWGESDQSGSEHYVDGYPRAAEIHMVHWNEDLYGSYEEAARSDEGIIILAVLVKISETRSNEALNDISEMLEDILYREQNVPLPREFPAEILLPEDIDKYWTYEGSFCTPPCYETVTWIVFEEPIFVSSKVLSGLRELRCYGESEDKPRDEKDGELSCTRRPIQPIGARKVIYVDCDLFRESHELGEQRLFRNAAAFAGRGSKAFGVGLQTFQAYLSKYSRDGLHGCSRGG